LQPLPGQRVGEDFRVYYVAGRLAWRAGDRTLYAPQLVPDAAVPGQLVIENPQLRFADSASALAELGRAVGVRRVLNYLYPPTFATLLSPLSHIPLRPATIVWRELNVVLLFATGLLALSLARAAAARPRDWLEVIMVFVAATFFLRYLDGQL